eukprot:gene4299-8547_t
MPSKFSLVAASFLILCQGCGFGVSFWLPKNLLERFHLSLDVDLRMILFKDCVKYQ